MAPWGEEARGDGERNLSLGYRDERFVDGLF